jgi:hypothetical protein
LDDNGAPNGFDRAVKHREKAVARSFDQPSVVFNDSGLNKFAPVSLDARVRPLLIESHESAIAGDISGQDSCETPWRLIGGIDPRPDGVDLT